MKLTRVTVRVESDHAKIDLTYNGNLVVQGGVPMGASISDTARTLREFARELELTALHGKRGAIIIPTSTALPKVKP